MSWCAVNKKSLDNTALDLFPSPIDVISLSKKIEHLSLAVSTQGLKNETERLKRRRLGSTLKQVRKETVPLRKILAQI